MTADQLTTHRISDVDLRELIRAYEGGGITHGFAPTVLMCLYELSNRRAADGLKQRRQSRCPHGVHELNRCERCD